MVALLIELCATAIPILSSDKNNLKFFPVLNFCTHEILFKE